jgi:bacillithiol system protein YtxJ
VYWVNVIEQRPLSNWIADTCGVRHQSPQLIKISGGRVEQHWSHLDISPRNLN